MRVTKHNTRANRNKQRYNPERKHQIHYIRQQKTPQNNYHTNNLRTNDNIMIPYAIRKD